MGEIIKWIISSIICVISQVYVAGKILNQKANFFEKRTILSIIIAVLGVTFLYKFIQNFIRVIITVCILMFINCLIFKIRKLKIILTTFLVNTLFALTEIFFSFIVISVFKIELNQYSVSFFGSIIPNLIISSIPMILVNVPIIIRKFSDFIEEGLEFKQFFIILLIFTGVFISAISIYSVYFKLNSAQLLLIMGIFIIVYNIFGIKLFNERSQRMYTQNRNDILIENISEYEKIIEIQKIDAHENKNQLRIIKEMVLPENKELTNYMNELINENLKKDTNLLSKVQDIPNGGLRALIYSKLVRLEPNFNINLIVSRKINSKTLDSIDPKTNVDMCKILGVFLDNAIEAAGVTDKKIVGISLYIENNFFKIIISNSYDFIELDKMGTDNYSTKGRGHGYGLLLVKKIIASNKKIKNSKKIDGELFSQILFIEINKM